MPTTPDGIVFPDVNSTYPEANWWVSLANSISGKIASSEAGEQRAINAAIAAEQAAALAEAATDGIEDIRDETVQARDDAVAAVQSVDDALDQVNQSAQDAADAAQAAQDAAALVDAPAGEVMDTYFGAIDGDLGHLYIPGAVSATPPPSPYVGQYWVDPSDDSLLTPSVTEVASRWLAGSGQPEGVVAAALGTRYTDTAAIAGAVEWIKTTTAGNTGWQVTHGDTKWRLITHPNVTSGRIAIRRYGAEAHLSLEAATLSAAEDLSDLIPAGFRPSVGSNPYVYGRTVPYFSANADRVVRAHYLGHLQISGVAASDVLQLDMQWLTDDLWPTTLPGTAA